MILRKKLYEHAGYLASSFNAFNITLFSIIKGLLGIDKKSNEGYSKELGLYSDRFRGKHVLVTSDEGELRCNGCMLCVTACPAECIHVDFVKCENDFLNKDKEIKSFDIELTRCAFCGLCVEACPIDAIFLSKEHIMVGEKSHEWVLGLEKLKDN